MIVKLIKIFSKNSKLSAALHTASYNLVAYHVSSYIALECTDNMFLHSCL